MMSESVKSLLHRKNVTVAKHISQISVKHKRHMFNLLRNLELPHKNFLFLENVGCTLSDFCAVQVLLSDGKRKFKDNLERKVKI